MYRKMVGWLPLFLDQVYIWRDRKSMKMVAWRGRKSRKMVVWQGLGTRLGSHGVIFWKILQKLGRRWAQDGRSWRQVAPKMGYDSAKLGQDSGKMVSFSSTWEVLAWFWEHFFAIWTHGLDSKKHWKTWGFCCFVDFGVVGRDDWGILGDILGDVGSKIRFFGAFLDMLGPRWWIRGARWRPRGSRWRLEGENWAPDGYGEFRFMRWAGGWVP